MCGFIGCFTNSKKNEFIVNSSLRMLKHRGPDHSEFTEHGVEGGFLYLGHTRLSIIDLSANAVQPFKSECGNFSLVFNGEIYNYRELRKELEVLGYDFNTDSDTEVLLYALIEWRLDCLSRLVGMFSFVFYDHELQRLTLARDAFGIKPFFYALHGGEIYFSSELRPLTHLRNESLRPNLQRAYDYLVHGDYDSDDQSFVEGVKHLLPAHSFTFDLKSGAATNPTQWWQPDLSKTSTLSFDDAAARLRELFLESVKLHLRSDVPLGVTLSGGIDSSAVAAAVRYLEPDMPLKTFSYIASDEKISEEKWVDLLNDKINARPNKVIATAHEMQDDLDDMLLAQGEPFGGTSIYAQYRVFKMVKGKGVKVTLDGQGADELLAGYSGYPGHRILSLIETKGWFAAHYFAKSWSRFPGRSYFLAWQYFARIKLPNWLYIFIRKHMGRDFKPRWLDTKYLNEHGVQFVEKRAPLHSNNKGKRVKEALANSLIHRGLPSLLRNGDRNSMAFSIESRVPFLTLPLAEFLLALPENYIISDEGETKHIFRKAMRGIVPDSHLDRKDKIGFETPEATWLLSMGDVIKEWINESPELPFLKKKELLQEFEQVIKRKRVLDGRVWRWVNYLRWCTLMDIK